MIDLSWLEDPHYRYCRRLEANRELLIVDVRYSSFCSETPKRCQRTCDKLDQLVKVVRK